MLGVLGAIARACAWFAYAPKHWLDLVTFPRVEIDDHPVNAEVYMGHPTESEAEAFALVHIPRVGDYLLDFEEERVRKLSNGEFVRLYRGAWMYGAMTAGTFTSPLPFQNLNEFRIASLDQRIITVKF